MSEPKTLEKIDTMLAALDDGTPGTRYFVDTSFGEDNAILRRKNDVVEEYVGQMHVLHGVADGTKAAWLLNSARPELVKMRAHYEAAEHDDSFSLLSAGVKAAIETIVNIRWQEFTGVRDAD